jgi:hypothetical protein
MKDGKCGYFNPFTCHFYGSPLPDVANGVQLLWTRLVAHTNILAPRGAGAGGLGSHRVGQKQLGHFVWLPTMDFAVSVGQLWAICLDAYKLIS